MKDPNVSRSDLLLYATIRRILFQKNSSVSKYIIKFLDFNKKICYNNMNFLKSQEDFS